MKRLIPVILFLLVCAPAHAAGEDLFDATDLGNGDLLIEHLNSYHNCCSLIGHEVTVDGFNILIREIESIVMYCWCECWFDVAVVISNLPPGAYGIHYFYDAEADIYEELWLTANLVEVMTGFDPMPGGATFVSSVSECTDGTSVATRSVTFDRLKALYR